MTEEKVSQTHKINKQQNQKIVQLIKLKLTPLHQKHKVFPKLLQPINMNKTTTCVASLLSPKNKIVAKQKNVIQDRRLSSPNTLLQKANLRIEQKKKISNQNGINQLKSRMPRMSLGSYLEIFSGLKAVNERKQTSQFQKINYQPQLFQAAQKMFDNVESSLVKDCQKELSQQSVCLMNAKYRKQMNHRKMIDFQKMKNRI